MKNALLTLTLIVLFTASAFSQDCQHWDPYTGPVSTAQYNFDDTIIGNTHDFYLKPFIKQPGHHSKLTFNLAYASQPERFDSLAIMISTDCGSTWETIFYSGGESMSTAAPTTDFFIPAADEWQDYEFNIHEYNAVVIIRFRFINGNGNNLFLDNVGFEDILSATEDVPDIKSSLYPNPFRDYGTLQLETPVQQASVVVIDSLGRNVLRLDKVQGDQIQMDGNHLMPGLYHYLLITEGKTKSFGQFVVVE